MRNVPGSVLRKERETAGVGQEAVARAMGVSVKTIQRIEAADLVKPLNADGYRAGVRIAVMGPDNVSRGTMRIGESVAEHDFPEWLRRRIDDAALELVRAGATNEQARYIREQLQSDATRRYVLRDDDGALRTDVDQRHHLDLLIESFGFWIERSAGVPAASHAPNPALDRGLSEEEEERALEAAAKKRAAKSRRNRGGASA